jgi:hypothetical protein
MAASLGELADHGAPGPSCDDAWDTNRRQLFYPYSAWAFTIGRAVHQSKMQPDEYSRRSSTASPTPSMWAPVEYWADCAGASG